MADQLSSDLASLRIQRDVDPDRRSPLRAFGVAFVVLAVAGSVAAYAYPKVKGEIYKTEIQTTEVSMVSPAQSSVTVTSTGYVMPLRVSKVGSKIPGKVAKVNVREGAQVKEGDVLVEIEDHDQTSAIAAASARVGAAKSRALAARANMAEVKQQAAREKSLVARGVTGKALLEDLTAREHALNEMAKAADADVRAAASEVESLRSGLRDRTVKAPISGMIVNKPPEVGEMVGPQTVIEIVDFESLVVETDVPEARLYQIKNESPAEIVLDAYPTKRYRGAAVEIGKRVNRAKATVVVRVRFVDGMENVLPEMAARVSFLSEQLNAEALKEPPKRIVPAGAVTDRAGAKAIFAVQDGKVRMMPITLGAPFGEGYEVVDGPPPGTKLVRNPPPELMDGQRIKEKE